MATSSPSPARVGWSLPEVRLHILAHEDRRRVQHLLFGLGMDAQLLGEVRHVVALLGLPGLGELLQGGHNRPVRLDLLRQPRLDADLRCERPVNGTAVGDVEQSPPLLLCQRTVE
jgi:hypothetical protein